VVYDRQVGLISFGPNGAVTRIKGRNLRAGDYDAKGNLVGDIGDGGPVSNALLLMADGLAIGHDGTIYMASSFSHRVRAVFPDGIIRTVAGTGEPGFKSGGWLGGSEGPGITTQLKGPHGLAIAPDDSLYIADWGNRLVRKLSRGQITTVAGTLNVGDGGPVQAATFLEAVDLFWQATGELLIADSLDKKIRKVDASGVIATLPVPGLRSPRSITADRSGTIYVEDSSTLYRIGRDNKPVIIALTSVGFRGVAVDSTGSVYSVSENRIHKFSNGKDMVVAGTGEYGSTGDGGPATAATIWEPRRLVVDKSDNLLFCDRTGIRKITPSGTISRIANTTLCSALTIGDDGVVYATSGAAIFKIVGQDGIRIAGQVRAYGYAGDGGLATEALMLPYGLAVDAQGNLYTAENQVIRKLEPVVPQKLTITSGERQLGWAGQTLPVQLGVKVSESFGIAVNGATVRFAVTSGEAQLSATTVTTDSQGIAQTRITLGSSKSVQVTATSGSLSPVTFTFAVGPVISPGSVVGAGLSRAPAKTLSPNTLVTVFGGGFAKPGQQFLAGDVVPVGRTLPQQLGGVCILVGDSFAPIVHVFPQQITFVMPSIDIGSTSVQVVANCGADEVKSEPEKVHVASSSPELFYLSHNPNGLNPVAAIHATTGIAVAAPAKFPGTNFSPAKPGEIISIFGTGFGPTDPATLPGELPDAARFTTQPIKIRIGPVDLADRDVLYTGVAPMLPGVYQVNIRVPMLPSGEYPVRLVVGNAIAPEEGSLTIAQ
jgi:uncharacterized protein (TIGR03437 family)